jgi:hypothetical protein
MSRRQGCLLKRQCHPVFLRKLFVADSITLLLKRPVHCSNWTSMQALLILCNSFIIQMFAKS